MSFLQAGLMRFNEVCDKFPLLLQAYTPSASTLKTMDGDEPTEVPLKRSASFRVSPSTMPSLSKPLLRKIVVTSTKTLHLLFPVIYNVDQSSFTCSGFVLQNVLLFASCFETVRPIALTFEVLRTLVTTVLRISVVERAGLGPVSRSLVSTRLLLIGCEGVHHLLESEVGSWI